MMIVVFMDEFAMLEGNATVKPGRGKDIESIEYVTTRRDMTWEGLVMEAPLFSAAGLFSDIEAYISETKTVLHVLFEADPE